MKVCVFGSGGQLGRELSRSLWPSGFELQAFTHQQVDIADVDAVTRAVATADIVINAAAYTAVDRAEADSEQAFRVNRDGPLALARACSEARAFLVHVSTDYVFDGRKNGPYLEDDTVCPLGVYGQSKAAGEQAVRSHCQRHAIIRTSWVVSSFGQNFVKTMLRLARERDQLRVVADQYGRPTPAKDLAEVIVSIATRHASSAALAPGTYHFAAAGRASWHDLASYVVEQQAPLTSCRPPVVAITTADYPTPAERPANSELDTSKLEAALHLSPRPWQAGVREVIGELLGQATTPT
jgi:dTDP-4-dehydrorhamnose reductase